MAETSRRLAELITNILRLNKLENQQIYPAVSAYDLGEQLRECLLSFESQWETKELEIEADIEEDVTVEADASCCRWCETICCPTPLNLPTMEER